MRNKLHKKLAFLSRLYILSLCSCFVSLEFLRRSWNSSPLRLRCWKTVNRKEKSCACLNIYVIMNTQHASTIHCTCPLNGLSSFKLGCIKDFHMHQRHVDDYTLNNKQKSDGEQTRDLSIVTG